MRKIFHLVFQQNEQSKYSTKIVKKQSGNIFYKKFLTLMVITKVYERTFKIFDFNNDEKFYFKSCEDLRAVNCNLLSMLWGALTSMRNCTYVKEQCQEFPNMNYYICLDT